MLSPQHNSDGKACYQNVEHDVGYGIMVSPDVMAPIHQHISCLRLDPSLEDYDESSIMYDDVTAYE